MTWQAPTNWYWDVQDSSPATQWWAGARGIFVDPTMDADALAFTAAGYLPTSIDTFANLMALIDSYNQGLWAGGQFNGVANRTFNANVTLTNPMLLTQEFTAGSTHSVTLPIMNVPGSIPKGVPFVIYANGPFRTFSVANVLAHDGVTVVASGINGGETVTILLTDNTTQNGSFVVTATTQPYPLPVQVGGTAAATLTQHAVLIGENVAPVVGVLLNDAQLLVGQTGADPQPKTVGGDVTMDDAASFTLVSIIAAGGPTGDASHVAQITYDAKGRLTAVTSVAITGTPPGGAAGGKLSGTYPNPGLNAASTDLTDSANLVRTIKKQTFSANGTYTPSTGMISCIIECVGGGAGGGSAVGTAGNLFGGGGGGSGSYSRLSATASDIGASKTVTVGAGGAGGAAANPGNPGAAGGDTSVGTLCIAKGGSGGAFGSVAQNGTPGAGGVAGTGDITATGMPGLEGMYNAVNQMIASAGGGGGGSSIFGGGAPNNQAANSTGGAAGNYGGGGAGGYSAGANNQAGGAGSAGLVVITEFCNQ